MEFELRRFGKSSEKNLEEKEILEGSTADKKILEHFAQKDNRYKFFSE